MENKNPYLRIQFKHEYQSESNPYPKDLETELQKINLPIIGWTDQNNQEAIIRHETGPEIILLISNLIPIASFIISLFNTWKKKLPETKIQITVTSAEELEKVLKVLNENK